jgi:hypothetical protein
LLNNILENSADRFAKPQEIAMHTILRPGLKLGASPKIEAASNLSVAYECCLKKRSFCKERFFILQGLYAINSA